jgi:hypothetical protein
LKEQLSLRQGLQRKSACGFGRVSRGHTPIAARNVYEKKVRSTITIRSTTRSGESPVPCRAGTRRSGQALDVSCYAYVTDIPDFSIH